MTKQLSKPIILFLDLLALLILLAYSGLALISQVRLDFAAVQLDPIWAQVQAQKQIRVATDVGFRPFADERDGKLIGYDIDLARAVANQMGVQVEFVPTGFDALYDALTSGRADMIASALPYAPEFGYRARFSTFYFDAGQVLVVQDDSTITGQDDLVGRRVGAALGSDADTYARRLAAANKHMTLDSQYDEPAQAITDLRRGILDAVITDNVTALSAIQSRSGLRIASALTSEPYVLAVPAEAFQLQAEVNEALDQLRSEGFFEKLNARWFR